MLRLYLHVEIERNPLPSRQCVYT